MLVQALVPLPLHELFACPEAASLLRALVAEVGRIAEADREAGRRTELDAIHGGLVRRAAELGVGVPALETCYRLALLRGVPA